MARGAKKRASEMFALILKARRKPVKLACFLETALRPENIPADGKAVCIQRTIPHGAAQHLSCSCGFTCIGAQLAAVLLPKERIRTFSGTDFLQILEPLVPRGIAQKA